MTVTVIMSDAPDGSIAVIVTCTRCLRLVVQGFVSKLMLLPIPDRVAQSERVGSAKLIHQQVAVGGVLSSKNSSPTFSQPGCSLQPRASPSQSCTPGTSPIPRSWSRTPEPCSQHRRPARHASDTPSYHRQRVFRQSYGRRCQGHVDHPSRVGGPSPLDTSQGHTDVGV